MEWQRELAGNLRETKDILPYLPLDETQQRKFTEILERYPMAVTPYYLSLINWDDPDDPIRRMAIPSLAETDMSGSFDTSNEAGNTVVEGLQHKYRETVMMLSTNQCAMYCRHCFRKRMVGLSDEEVAKHFDEMWSYIASHDEITNVLISGGDALMNSNARLERILGMLAEIPHLDNVRIATRTPVVLPSRILTDKTLLRILSEFNDQKQLYLVTQFNHPKELTPSSRAAVWAVLERGIPVRNQTVLMKGVNDDPQVLGNLLRGLIRAGVEPYYVFQCRPVRGVKNQFQVPLRRGIAVVEEAKALQNGLGKCFKFCMSHPSGKLEILGLDEKGQMLFKFHEAKNRADLGRIFSRELAPGQAWLEE